ncbi:MAG TPA: hypothetical protein ENK75_05670 [Saprospiraceae bacterium]|nr:hypothetical protein [Saprospiraceae bacterium]
MRAMSFYYNGNEISVHNSIWGAEKVKYNGREMTSQFSVLGGVHHFEVIEDGERVVYEVRLKLSMIVGVSFSIWRNDEPLLLGADCRKREMSVSGDSDFV